MVAAIHSAGPTSHHTRSQPCFSVNTPPVIAPGSNLSPDKADNRPPGNTPPPQRSAPYSYRSPTPCPLYYNPQPSSLHTYIHLPQLPKSAAHSSRFHLLRSASVNSIATCLWVASPLCKSARSICSMIHALAAVSKGDRERHGPRSSLILRDSNNGLKVPQIGFGTWQAAPGEVEKA